MTDSTVMWVCLALTAVVLLTTDAIGAPRKTYDEAKAERLAKQRMERRAIEVRYEACVRTCEVRCR